jgi:hypothetical protein
MYMTLQNVNFKEVVQLVRFKLGHVQVHLVTAQDAAQYETTQNG